MTMQAKTIHDPRYRKIIQKLVDKRRSQGLTQHTVADKLGVTQSYISKVESFEICLDILELKQFSIIYNIKLGTLLKELLNE